MIKNFFLVILSLIVLAAVAITVHLPTKHLAFRYYHGFQLYLTLESNYQAEAACKSDETIQLCVTGILKNSDGFKFGTDVGFAMGVLMNKNLSYNSFIQANTLMVRAVDPEKFWIRGIKGKAAKKVFKQEKQALAKAFTVNKEQTEAVVKEGRFPASHDDHASLIMALQQKIQELSE